MARAAVKAKQQQKASAKPTKAAGRPRGRHHKSGGNPNQQLFFSRMRRQAKFVYFLLAILFALTFAFLGVGSGSNSGLERPVQQHQHLRRRRRRGLRLERPERDPKHPNSPKGYRELATAYEGKNDTASAITALQQYLAIKKTDGKALSELAGPPADAGGRLPEPVRQRVPDPAAGVARARRSFPTGKLGTAIGTNPIEQSQSSLAGQSASNLDQSMSLAYANAVDDLPAAGEAPADNADAQFQLGNTAQTAAQITGSSTFNATAVAAYKAYVKLNPDASTAAQVRQLIKQLEPAPAKPKKKR